MLFLNYRSWNRYDIFRERQCDLSGVCTMRHFFQMVALAVFLLSIAAQGQNIYVAQASAGGRNGVDCADARDLGNLTAGDWAPGNTIHLCGTITSPTGSSGLVALGSGTSSQPITIKFEPGTILQSPYFGYNNGCSSLATCLGGIEVYNRNYIVIDGGTNGIIQNTLCRSMVFALNSITTQLVY